MKNQPKRIAIAANAADRVPPAAHPTEKSVKSEKHNPLEGRILKHRNPLYILLNTLLYTLLAILLPGLTDAHDSGTSFAEDRLTFHHAAKDLPQDAVVSDWPSMLGPSHNARSIETKLSKNWSVKEHTNDHTIDYNGPKLVWSLVRGEGYASPSLADGRLIYFHRIADEEVVECRNPETGKLLWQHRYPTTYKDRYGFNNGPRCAPFISGNRVVTYGADGSLRCLEVATGELLWKHNILTEFSATQEYFGVGPGPLVQDGRVIINVGAPQGPEVVALDLKTGKTLWESKKSEKPEESWGASYATPIPGIINGRDRIFVFAGGDSRPPTGGLLMLDPATGKIDARFPFRSKRYESVNASSPTVVGNQVFISTSYKTGGILLNINGSSTPSVAWRTKDLGTHFATTIHKDGYLYGVDGGSRNNTAISCIELATGKLMWRTVPEWKETVTQKGKSHEVTYTAARCSLLYADGAFLCLTEEGHLLWLKMAPKGCQILSRTWLFAAKETYSMPVISRGLLYVVQNRKSWLDGSPTRLFCYDLRAAE